MAWFPTGFGGRAGARFVKGWDKDQDGRTVVRRDREGGCSRKVERVCVRGKVRVNN